MLSQQRTRIDQIDQEIVRLFEERTKIVEEVAQIKWENGLEVLDQGREDAVIHKVQGYLENPDLAREIADLYTQLMRISRGHQEQWMKNQAE